MQEFYQASVDTAINGDDKAFTKFTFTMQSYNKTVEDNSYSALKFLICGQPNRQFSGYRSDINELNNLPILHRKTLIFYLPNFIQHSVDQTCKIDIQYFVTQFGLNDPA